MIGLMITLSLLFTWLLYETQWLRIRLPQCTKPELRETKRELNIKFCHSCRNYTKIIPARTLKLYGYTFNLIEGCNRCRAKLLKQVAKAQRPPKTHQSHRVAQFVEGMAQFDIKMPQPQNHQFMPILEISNNGSSKSFTKWDKPSDIKKFVKALSS